MKKVILILVSLVLSVMIQAKTVTINVVTPGSLSTLVSTKDSVTNLVLTGTIDSVDIFYMRDSLSVLVSVDLSKSNIVTNSIPNNAFVKHDILVWNINKDGYVVSVKDTIKIKRYSDIILPSNIISIGEYAFQHDTLNTLSIPSTIKNINIGAFQFASIKTLYSYTKTPIIIDTTNNGVFDYYHYIETYNKDGYVVSSKEYVFIDSICKLYVPFGSKKLYEKVAGWNHFKNIVEMVSTNDSTTIVNKDTTSTIKLNGDWTVESSESFVTFDKTSGTADSLLTIKIEENTTDSTRTAYVSIIVDDTTKLKSLKTITLTITQTGTVISKVSEVNTNKLNVYPNPCVNSFSVNVEKESTIEVYSITGSLVLKTIVNNNESVDVSDLTTGSYIVKVGNDSKILVKK